MKKIILVIILSLTVSACLFEKKIDVKNDETMKNSIKEIMKELSEEDQERFQKSLQIIMFDGVNNLMDLAVMGQNIEATKGAFLAKVDGKTAKEIFEIADRKKQQKTEAPKVVTTESLVQDVQKEAIIHAIDAKLVQKENIKTDFEEGVSFDIVFKNLTDKDIKGVKGITVFKDIFGDVISNISISMDHPIMANGEYKYNGGFKINRFDADDQKLKNTPLDKIQFEFVPKIILFKDGTQLPAKSDQ